MVLKEITFLNIPPIPNKVFFLNSGLNRIGMESAQENSVFLECMYSVFSFFSDHTFLPRASDKVKSHLSVRFDMTEKSFRLDKIWEKGELLQHRLTTDDESTELDLLNVNEREAWCRKFLRNYDTLCSEENTYDQTISSYEFLISLLFRKIATPDITSVIWLRQLFDVSDHGSFTQKITHAQNAVSSRIIDLKTVRQRVETYIDTVSRFEHDLAKVDSEINRVSKVIDQLQEEFSALDVEHTQAEKIHEFVIARKHEIEKIDFEIRSYRSVLKNDTSTEFSEDEIAEISEKSKWYEKILKQEELLGQRRIEQSHLEKNLQIILNEIAHQRIDQTQAGSQAALKRIMEFESEICRIKDELKNYHGMDRDEEMIRKEKNLHRSSFEKFNAIKELKQTLNRNEHKHVESAMHTMENEKERLLMELEQMQADLLEDRYRIIRDKVQRKRQQIAEQRMRLETLCDRRLQILREIESAYREEQDLAPIESDIRKQIQIRKYLGIAGEFSDFIQREIIRIRKMEFKAEINKIAGSTSFGYLTTVEDLLEKSEIADNSIERESYDEFDLFLFRLACLGYRTKFRTVVLSGELQDSAYFKNNLTNALSSLGFAQIVLVADR
jgi:hypothetical protein